MYQYVFWKDVQDVLYRKKEENHINSFYTAFTEAFQDHRQESEELPYPDFRKWDCTDADALFDLYCQLPVTAANVGTPPIQHRQAHTPKSKILFDPFHNYTFFPIS